VKIPEHIKRYKCKKLVGSLLVAVLTAVILMAVPLCSYASEISTLAIKQIDNEIVVSTSLKLDQSIVDEVTSGLSKEFIFKLELYRYVKFLFPNEFITSKTIIRALKSNPIKREYIGTGTDNGVKTVQRFKDIDSMLAWAVNLPELKMIGTKGLNEGNYFITVTAESRVHSLPAVVGYILFFLPTKEFSVNRESELFKIQLQGVK
jgi:hypothetical protein